MKILIIQEAGKHPANFHFREALNLQRAFNRLGHQCIVWGSGYSNYTTPFEEVVKDRDVLLLLENYEENNWVPDLSGYKMPKLFWSIDAHYNLNQHLETVDRQKIDHILSSTSSYYKNFIKEGVRTASWFPNAYPMDLFEVPNLVQKQHDVGFCGNTVNAARADWINFLMIQARLKFDHMVLGKNMISAIKSYKISWNRSVGIDINCRNFETLGCGTFLLTNYVDKLEDLFSIKEHLVTYTDPKDCLDKINYFIINEKEREEIAKKGYEHVKQWHTYDCRAVQFIELLNKL